MDRNWNAEAAATAESTAGSPVRIDLEEQDHSFALDRERKLKGLLTMSSDRTNTVIDINLENLNADAGNYRLFFLGRKDGTSVYKLLGEVVPDRQGHAYLQKEIKTEDADGKGTPLSCFYIFVLAAAGEPLRLVLKGDLARHIEKKEGRAAIRKNVSYNSYYSEYILEKIRRLVKKTVQSEDISPFDDVWLARNWKRVTDCSELPVASIGGEQQAEKYGHFIFASSEEHFYLAVPGRHTDEEWPDRGRSGFIMWQSIRGSEEYGYWCMIIDSKTGIITEIS